MREFFAELSHRRKQVVGRLFWVQFAIGFGLIMLGAVLPAMRESYGLSYGLGGMLISVQAVGYLGVGLFSGILAERLGQKRAYLLLYSLVPLGFAMTLFSGAPLWLLAAMLLVGLGKGGASDYNNRLMSIYSHGDSRPLNLLHAFFAIGACLAPLLVLLCQNGGRGWKTAMAISAVGLLAALVSVCFTRMDDEQTSQSQSGSHPYGFFREAVFWSTALIDFFYQAVEATIMGWLTSYYIEAGLLGPNSAQTATALMWAALLLGRLACSLMAANGRPWRMMVMMSGGIAGFLALLLLGGGAAITVLATVGLGLCMSGMYGTSIANAGDLFSRYPLCMGMFITLTGLGAVLMPQLVGAAAERTGSLREGFVLLLAAAVCMLAVTAVNDRLMERRK